MIMGEFKARLAILRERKMLSWIRKALETPKAVASGNGGAWAQGVLPDEVKSVSLGPGLYLYYTSPKLPPPAVHQNTTVNACIRAIAAAAANAPPIIRVDGQVVPDHPAADLIRRIAPEGSWPEFLFSALSDYVFSGQALVYIEQDRAIRLPGAYVQALVRRDISGMVDLDQPVAGFRVVGAEGGQVFPAEAVAWIASRRPDRPWEVIPPASRLLPLIQVDNLLNNIVESVARNGGLVPFILVSEYPLDERRIQEFKERWLRRTMPEMGMGIPPILNQVEVVRVGSTVQEMGLQDLKALIDIAICMELGVPPVIVGSFSGLRFSTYANYRTAVNAFRQFTVIPFLRRLAAALSGPLSYAFGQDIAVDFDWRYFDFSTLMGDMDQIVRLYQAGILSRDEAREAIGYPPATSAEAPAEPPRRGRRTRAASPRRADPESTEGRHDEYPPAEYAKAHAPTGRANGTGPPLAVGGWLWQNMVDK